jgi:hypothetical protein
MDVTLLPSFLGGIVHSEMSGSAPSRQQRGRGPIRSKRRFLDAAGERLTQRANERACSSELG